MNRMVEYHSAEGDLIHEAYADEDLEAGQAISFMGRVAICSRDMKRGRPVAAIKRGVISLFGPAFPGIFPGFRGPVYGTQIGVSRDIELYHLAIFGDVQFGVVEGWDFSDRRSPRFLLSLGDPSTSADGIARGLAQDALDAAQTAQADASLALSRFPVNFNALYTTPELNNTIAAGATKRIGFANLGPTDGILPKPGDGLGIVAPAGMYLMMFDFTINGATGLELSLLYDGDTNNSFDGRLDLAPAGRQFIHLARFYGAPHYLTVDLKNTTGAPKNIYGRVSAGRIGN